MTSLEAVALIQDIQAKFQAKFKQLDLMNAWPQLLRYRVESLERVAGRIIKSSKYLPKMDYVLEGLAQVEASPARLPERLDPEKEATAAFRMMAGHIVGAERVKGLYWLADRTHKPHYALEAWTLSQKILAENEQKPSGNNLETSPPN